ncbi:MAG TPA: aldose 1-epimerase [Bryobacteraceae bacterium]|nr:aldose 1-epimerase [Bryobacteraceae bacterium]
MRQLQVGGTAVVQLADVARRMEVSIAPSIGNMAYAFLVNGKNVLWFPYAGPDELRARPALCGIPFLGPWANRLDGDAYWVNGRQYLLNPALQNLRRDERGKPIHGLLNFSPAWKLVSAGAGHDSAYAVSRLPFWQYPELMAQFPFAHNLTMTYRLTGGSLEVELLADNYSTEPLPVAFGFHPYFTLHDAPRDDWRLHVAAREHLLLDESLIPTGAAEPSQVADPHLLRAAPLDDVFTGLVRESDNAARFWVAGGREKITVAYGPNYRVAIVFAPAGRDFLCFEPMSAVTNAFNLAQAGRYPELQTIPPGGQWRESFWITPSGF